MKNIRCLLVLTGFLAAVPAYADTDVTLFGAAQHQGKLNVQSAATTVSTISSFDPGNFGTYGVRFSHGKVFGGEHTIAYAPHFIDVNTKALITNSNLLLQAPLPKVEPYVTAGAGFIFTFGTDAQGLPSFGKIGNKFALNYGGGVKILPAGPVGIRLDVRGYIVPGVNFNLPSLTNPLATVQSQSQTLNMLEAGVGIVFAFGK